MALPSNVTQKLEKKLKRKDSLINENLEKMKKIKRKSRNTLFLENNVVSSSQHEINTIMWLSHPMSLT